MAIPFGGLSLQEDCHYLLYIIVRMLLDASHELHFGDAKELACFLVVTDLLGDMRFCD